MFQRLGVLSLETPQRKWASSRLEARTSWIFLNGAGALDLQREPQGPPLVASGKASPHASYSGASRDLSCRCWGLRPCVEKVPEPEDSSLVLSWILGNFWSLPRGVSPRLEWGHTRALSSRTIAAVSCFPSRGSRDLCFPSRLSHEAFPQGCPTCHRGVSRSSA